MSAKPRCALCLHPRGERRPNVSRSTGRPRKAPCGCACHASRGAVAATREAQAAITT